MLKRGLIKPYEETNPLERLKAVEELAQILTSDIDMCVARLYDIQVWRLNNIQEGDIIPELGEVPKE